MKSVNDILFSIERNTFQRQATQHIKDDIYLGDPIIDKATREVLNQLSSHENFDIWQQINRIQVNQLICKEVKSLFVKDNVYHKCSVLVYDGEHFNNEIGTKIAIEGTVTATKKFVILNNIGTTIIDRSHYDTLYTFMPISHKIWMNKKNDGRETWVDMELKTTYMIGKQTDSFFQLLNVYPVKDYFMVLGNILNPEYRLHKRSLNNY